MHFFFLLVLPVGERGDHKEGEHDERHALQEPPHQTVSHAEERGGQPTAGGTFTRTRTFLVESSRGAFWKPCGNVVELKIGLDKATF